jgi:hypothetical protein
MDSKTKLYGWAKVPVSFTNSRGSFTHYKNGQFFEVGANDVTPDDGAAKHCIFASSETELLHAVSEYKRINKLI